MIAVVSGLSFGGTGNLREGCRVLRGKGKSDSSKSGHRDWNGQIPWNLRLELIRNLPVLVGFKEVGDAEDRRSLAHNKRAEKP